MGLQQEQAPQDGAPALLANFNGIDYTGSFPPDPVLAAGPSNLVLATNGSVTIRSKAGTFVASISLEAFFGGVRAADESVFDPRVVYDSASGRFFLMAVGYVESANCSPGTCVAHFFMAVSKTSSPVTIGSDDWYFYALDATLDGTTPTANVPDFSGLGVDGSVVVLTTNMFSIASGEFQTAKIRVLNKSVLITGGSVTWTDFVGLTDPETDLLSFSLQPALTFGTPGTFFLVSSSSALDSCDLVVWGIQSPLSAPVLSKRMAAAGGTCPSPPAAPQLGGGTPLDTGDYRLLNAVYRNGSLWTAHAVGMNFGSGNVAASRWVQIDVSGWPNSVALTQDSTFGADGLSYFYPTVMVDAANNLTIALARSSPSEYGSAHYTGRLGGDPLNTLRPSALLKAGTANQDLVDQDGLNRYGDYLGMALDPTDGTFWMMGEYVKASEAWGAWVGHIAFSMPDKIGIFRNGTWYLDSNGDGGWSGCATDKCISWGDPGDLAVLGDWNGDGRTKIGVYRPSNGFWFLDADGSGTWGSCGPGEPDNCIAWGGEPGDTPVLGDWNGDGRTKIGIYRNGTWYLDANGNGLWDGCNVERCIVWGNSEDIPIVGDWNGDGRTKIGIFRSGLWYLDYNGDGLWNGCDVDRCISWGDAGDRPVLGDWNGDGRTKIGIYRNGTWYLDANGDGLWDGCDVEKCIAWGGPSDKVVVGDWNGDGRGKVGIVRDGIWYLDHNGNGLWDGCGTDKCISWGNPGDTFVVGKW